MELQTIDYIFWGFITLVVLGGVGCLIVFLPKEHELEEQTADCYRIVYRDGVYAISPHKASYGENVYSLRSKFFYIKKVPFHAEAFCDEAVGKDGKKYRAVATLTVYFPEDKLQVFAPTFHGSSHEAVEETVGETVSAGLTEAMEDYEETVDKELFTEFIKHKISEKLEIFGLILISMPDLKITENK
ncbi:MAG: hypothetical protein II820_11730 [Ruminiclostridium sp.]|nr:hypothetical protein [Ruminiclostridium sp.]